MKTRFKYAFVAFLTIFIFASCNKKDKDVKGEELPTPDASADIAGEAMMDGGSSTGGGDNGQQQSLAGQVTAAEWQDILHWDFWSKLMLGNHQDSTQTDYSKFSDYWRLYTNNLLYVEVNNNLNEPIEGVQVELRRKGSQSPAWQAVTDIYGHASLWYGFLQATASDDASGFELLLNGEVQDQTLVFTHWGDADVAVNLFTYDAGQPETTLDLAFIVDATGSMGDEINFLKDDLLDILNQVKAKQGSTAIRTGALFYRDEGDEYLTRHSNFTTDFSQTISFIKNQNADGGGDFPEAVHTALERGLQDLSWSETTSVKLAFLLLDAPPHYNDQVIQSLQKSIPLYAEKGIHIIPVAASGVDKETEFFLRFTALATDGTYLFLTNDSGIGGDHLQATVGEYEVMPLNDLMVKVINRYLGE